MRKVINIAIISDLHCHSLENNDNYEESMIIVDKETPTLQDPYKSFIELIKNDHHIRADILLIPGDITNKACPNGLKKGIAITNHFKELLSANDLYYTIGNHDVDSRRKYSDLPLEKLKSIDNYPFADDDKNSFFWSNGYFIEELKDIVILNVNSSFYHTEEMELENGKISFETVKELRENLIKIKKDKVFIAFLHHCLIEHSHYNSGSNDFLHNGDDLTKLLDELNFKIVIHGHKHDPRLRTLPGGIESPFLFSSGSFSSVSEKLLLGGHNTFHIINLFVSGDNKGKGLINTWFFTPTKGWSNTFDNTYFESINGFGAVIDLEDTTKEIIKLFKSEKFLEWKYIREQIPNLKFVMTSDLKKLFEKLKRNKIYIQGKYYDDSSILQKK